MARCKRCGREIPEGCEVCASCAPLRVEQPQITIHVVSGTEKPHGPNCGCLMCPNCGAPEVDDCRKPVDEWKWNIKAFRVDDWSH